MEFNGGGGIVGLNPNGGFIPTNNVAQNQANLDYVNAQNQAALNANNLYGPGGFGYQTDQYSAAGAAYGRATGYYGDPYSSTPVSPTTGAGYADRSTLDAGGQAYYDAHVARYGAPPDANNPSLHPSGAPAPPAPPATAPSAFNTGAPAYNTYGQPGTGGNTVYKTDPQEGGPLVYDSLNAAQKAYYDAHVAKYGTAPGTGNSSIMGMGGPFQSATGNVGQSPGMAPGMGGFNNPPPTTGVDYVSLSPGGQAYYNAHVARYGFPPEANNPGLHPEGAHAGAEANVGGGPGVPALGGIGPGSSGQVTGGGVGGGGDFYGGLGPGGKAYYDAHVARYGAPPEANNPGLHPASDAGIPTSGPGSGVDAINKFAGIDPNTNEQFPPGIDRNTGQPFVVPPPTPGEALPFTGNPVNAQQPDFYRSPEQSYKTFQAPALQWRTSIPNNDPTIANAIYRIAGNTGIDPASIAAMFKLEGSNYDPRYHTGSHYGIAQMSANQWKDQPFGGTIGGLTWDQYQNEATADQQIEAYGDWLTRSNNLNKYGVSGVSDQSPQLQAAILQAIQFAPNSPGWRTALQGGDMSSPATLKKQAEDLGNKSIGDMEDYYDKLMAGWK